MSECLVLIRNITYVWILTLSLGVIIGFIFTKVREDAE
jgi:phosphate/sulfate permease